MQIQPTHNPLGTFVGFSVFVGGEWTTATDYKAAVLAYRRAMEDSSADPIQDETDRSKQ